MLQKRTNGFRPYSLYVYCLNLLLRLCKIEYKWVKKEITLFTSNSENKNIIITSNNENIIKIVYK